MNHNRVIKEQLLHLVFGTAIFTVIGAFAVGLDLASSFVKQFGVTAFTSQALELSAHALLIVDLVLFFIYLLVTSIELAKGMVKHD